VLSSSLDWRPFGHNRYDRKFGGVPLWRGELGPHLIQFGEGRGVHPCQVSSGSIQPFDHNIHGPRVIYIIYYYRGLYGRRLPKPAPINFECVGRLLCSLPWGSWIPTYSMAGTEAYLHAKFHLDPSNSLATAHQRHRHRTEQRSDRIRRTVLQTVGQKSDILAVLHKK